jgi:predicted nucleic acid-binding Zn ribbon protein
LAWAGRRDELNARRRADYRAEHPLPTRPCVVCGENFSGRPDALVCGPECRRQRKLEQRRRYHSAKWSPGRIAPFEFVKLLTLRAIAAEVDSNLHS